MMNIKIIFREKLYLNEKSLTSIMKFIKIIIKIQQKIKFESSLLFFYIF